MVFSAFEIIPRVDFENTAYIAEQYPTYLQYLLSLQYLKGRGWNFWGNASFKPRVVFCSLGRPPYTFYNIFKKHKL